MKSNLLKWKMGAAAVLITLLGTPMFSQCPDGMVSYWGLDESVSTVYVDRVGGHNATAVSAPSNITGIVGNAKYFDGTKQVSVSSHSDYDFENNEGFSIAFWAKFSDVSFGTYNKILIGKNEPYATTGAKWWIASQLNSGLMSFTLVDSYGTQYNVSGTAINDDNWHYIVAVRDPDSNTIKLYIDGVAAGSTPTAYSGDFSSTAPIQIGFLNRQSIPDYWYKGALDEIAIFSRALETVEIMEQWTKGTLGIGYCDGYSPVIKSEPLLTAAVGQVYTYDVQASGMPPITFSLDEAPAGMTINPSTGVITWTPGSINVNGFVRVIASNPSYPPAAQQEFTINIASAPSCPPGLISLWRLNETAGPVYEDLYGVRDAIADIAPTPAAGIVGGAQTFTGTTTVNIVDDGSWEWPANVSFSIETWVKSTNVG